MTVVYPASAAMCNRRERLGQRPDLVDLDQDRVGHPLVDALLQARRVGHKHVIADQLEPLAELLRQRFHPSQSSSAIPSSSETIGYRPDSSAQ